MGKLVPAPGLEGVAGPLVEVPLHGDPVGCIGIEIHDGVIVGHILETFQKSLSVSAVDVAVLIIQLKGLFLLLFVCFHIVV